jgi:acetyltransferase-like isoleucine patch superfamily enzyme
MAQIDDAKRRLLNRATCRKRISGHGNAIHETDAILRRVTFELDGDGHQVHIGRGARVTNTLIRMSGRGHILRIGAGVTMNGGQFDFYDTGCEIAVGDRSMIYEAEFGVTEGGNITVGEDCLFSTGVDLRNGDSHSILSADSRSRINPAADVVVGDRVWLGARVMLLKGATVGADSVLGAGSIVTGAVPAGCAAVGAPARVVREGITWTKERL